VPKRKSAEDKLVEAVREMGLIKAESIIKTLVKFNDEDEPRKRKPKLVKADAAG